MREKSKISPYNLASFHIGGDGDEISTTDRFGRAGKYSFIRAARVEAKRMYIPTDSVNRK